VFRVTNGNVVDHRATVEHVAELGKNYDVREVIIDRWIATAVQLAGQDSVIEGGGKTHG
jgi:phage terminase large subunit-like protein